MTSSDCETGSIKIHEDISSRFLEQSRNVYVYVPPGYDSRGNHQRYPVLYMHDGNNLFDARLAFGGHEWKVDATADRLIQAGQLEPLIIVGVSNSSDRMEEYTWVPGTLEGKPMGGAGASYARFLVEELKPQIDAAYRTKPGRAHTGVLGSSLGGLISLYLGIFHWDTFQRIGIVSPSLFWSNRAALHDSQRIPDDLRIWLDMGWDEGQTGVMPGVIKDLRGLKKNLESKGYAQGKNFHFMEDLYGEHDEDAWARRLPLILPFLFGTNVPAMGDADDGES
jgi:predicted alpha/beta superfamily hydrolase